MQLHFLPPLFFAINFILFPILVLATAHNVYYQAHTAPLSESGKLHFIMHPIFEPQGTGGDFF